jgi:hypothetical protein
MFGAVSDNHAPSVGKRESYSYSKQSQGPDQRVRPQRRLCHRPQVHWRPTPAPSFAAASHGDRKDRHMDAAANGSEIALFYPQRIFPYFEGNGRRGLERQPRLGRIGGPGAGRASRTKVSVRDQVIDYLLQGNKRGRRSLMVDFSQ